MSSPLLLLLVACTLGAIALAGYSAWLLRGRKRSEIRTVPTGVAPPPPQAPRPVRLPGMPPRHEPTPPTWAAVERQLEAPHRARGSVPPPARVAPNRFDDVATAGLPIVVPPDSSGQHRR